MIAADAGSHSDAALKRLVASLRLPVHLVCDATYRLLAASPPRLAAWRVDISEYLGGSLWRYASPEIVVAEAGLADAGWYDEPNRALTFVTSGTWGAEIRVRPSTMRWETIPLAGGRVGRLTTTLSWDA